MANTYLTRTTGTASLNTKMTFSTWVKRSSISSSVVLFSFSSDSNNELYFRFMDNDTLQVFSQKSGTKIIERKTNRVFRDVSAWYHLVLQIDTTQSTASDRIKIYVNGVQETSFSAETNPNQNEAITYVSSATFEIGRKSTSSNLYLNGSMSHVHFIDGTAYDASAFGETDTTTGEWEAKTSPSVTYGNNGFFILKDGNTITDQSSNSNDFTLGGGTLTDLKDNPDNVFATWNPLDNLSGHPASFSNGNTTVSIPNSGGKFTSTLAVNSGKYYCEVKLNTLNSGLIGIQPIENSPSISFFNSGSNGIGLYSTNGTIYQNGSLIGDIASVADNDIIGMAIDLDNNNIYFSKNGQYASGLSGSWNQTFSNAYARPITSGYSYCVSGQNGGSGTSSNFSANFGNGYFGTTAVSSAGTNASDNGIFEYDVPTGYTALSTKGLNL